MPEHAASTLCGRDDGADPVSASGYRLCVDALVLNAIHHWLAVLERLG
jgi:hypothetical protein